MTESSVFDLFGDPQNADPFRLSIPGFAKIDDLLTDALVDAFGGDLPRAVREAHFNVRVAVANAVGLVPDVFKGPLGKLAEIRNKFAHARLDELTVSHGREFYACLRELAPDVDEQVPGLKGEEQPEIHLINLLATVEVGLRGAFEDARERRERQEEAMREWWEKRRPAPLSSEQISELLRNEATSSQEIDEKSE